MGCSAGLLARCVRVSLVELLFYFYLVSFFGFFFFPSLRAEICFLGGDD
jgi:hypothetical protein